jgi:hypothetical protein
VGMPTDGTFGTNGNGSSAFEFQVVSWANSNVAHGVVNGSSATSFTATPASADVTRTFALHTSRMASVSESGNQICARRLSGEVTDGTTLTFTRGCNPSSHDIGNISWERVELPASTVSGGATVQRFTPSIANNSSSVNVSVTTVDRTRAFAFMGGQGFGGVANGRTRVGVNGGDPDRLGCSQAIIDFNSATQIGLTRTTTNADCNFSSTAGQGDWGVFLVEVTP